MTTPTHPLLPSEKGEMSDTQIRQAEKICDLVASGHSWGAEQERAAIVKWMHRTGQQRIDTADREEGLIGFGLQEAAEQILAGNHHDKGEG